MQLIANDPLEKFKAAHHFDINSVAYASNWPLKKNGFVDTKEDRKSASFTKKGPGRKHRQGS